MYVPRSAHTDHHHLQPKGKKGLGQGHLFGQRHSRPQGKSKRRGKSKGWCKGPEGRLTQVERSSGRSRGAVFVFVSCGNVNANQGRLSLG